MVVNQTECSRFEQGFVIKLSVSEKCKTMWNFQWICDIFRQKMITNWLNICLPPKRQWTHTDSPVKFLEQAVNKEVYADRFLGYEGTYNYFLERVAVVNSASYYFHLKQYSPYLSNDLCVYVQPIRKNIDSPFLEIVSFFVFNPGKMKEAQFKTNLISKPNFLALFPKFIKIIFFINE